MSYHFNLFQMNLTVDEKYSDDDEGYEEGKCIDEDEVDPGAADTPQEDSPHEGIPQGYSLFVLSPTNPLRNELSRISQYFLSHDMSIRGLILKSS